LHSAQSGSARIGHSRKPDRSGEMKLKARHIWIKVQVV
jgi:hypothetical protein